MKIRLAFLLPLLLPLIGCPDPTAVADGSVVDQAMPDPNGAGIAADGAPLPPPQEGATPGAGGTPGGVAGGRPEVAGFTVEPGKGVKLSGEVIYAGSKTGTLRIDFLKNTDGATFPELVHTLTLEKPGPWTVEAPADLGDVSIVSFIDTNNNGPSEGEPAGMIEKTTVGSSDLAKLDITLSDTPDLGSLKPTPGAGAKEGGVPPQPPTGPSGGTAPATGAASGPAPVDAPPGTLGVPAGPTPDATGVAPAGGAPVAPPK